ncbi:hypothetical protein KKG45_03280, partial [bacterium]|nr:hypothetical protein [bacterium]
MDVTAHRSAVAVLLSVVLVANSRADGKRLANARPALPPATLEPEELWRAGGEDDDIMFGLPVETPRGRRGPRLP